MKRTSLIFCTAFLTLLSGCASVAMQSAPIVQTAPANKVLVNFVRPAVFLGDGVSVDVWDGERYVGAMRAGKMIQYEAEPGKHVFLANAENWSYATGDLVAGKQYYLKVNLFPGVLYGRAAIGVAKKDDARVADWLEKLKPTVVAQRDRQKIEEKKGAEVKKALANFESGQVSSFSTITPEDAR